MYNLVNVAALKKLESFEESGDFPSYISIGILPFSRIYLVSKDRKKAEDNANSLNQLFLEQGDPVDFKVQQLSQKGKLRFYRDRYLLGNLTFILGESMDLDTHENKRLAYANWYFSHTVSK